jgi:hypothetical protein
MPFIMALRFQTIFSRAMEECHAADGANALGRSRNREGQEVTQEEGYFLCSNHAAPAATGM